MQRRLGIFDDFLLISKHLKLKILPQAYAPTTKTSEKWTIHEDKKDQLKSKFQVNAKRTLNFLFSSATSEECYDDENVTNANFKLQIVQFHGKSFGIFLFAFQPICLPFLVKVLLSFTLWWKNYTKSENSLSILPFPILQEKIQQKWINIAETTTMMVEKFQTFLTICMLFFNPLVVLSFKRDTDDIATWGWKKETWKDTK